MSTISNLDKQAKGSISSEHDIMQLFRRRSLNIANMEMISEEQIFPFFLTCIKKLVRNSKENQIISFFLKKMNEFINLIRNSHENVSELLGIISSCLGYQFVPCNKVLFKVGDKGDKFFIILKGKVNILILKEITIMMSEQEYCNYIQKLINMGENQILNNCLQANNDIYSLDPYSPKRRSTRRSVNNLYANANIKTNGEYASFTEYIESIKPVMNEMEISERKEVKIWEYFYFDTLTRGEYFGDAALTYIDQKRTATIFVEEESHFGILNKDTFDKCIKEANENQKLSNLSFLLSFHLFSDFSQKYFKLHYLNFFKKLKISIYDKIITEGFPPISTYFIKDGEFEISFRKSLIEINEYLKEMGEIDEFVLEEGKVKMNDSPKFYKFMHEKKLHRISIVRSKELIGLDDLIFKNKYGFSVECLTSKGEIYKIENNLLEMICDKEINMKHILGNLVRKKQEIIIDRLKKIRLSRLDFYNKNIENDYIPRQNKVSSKLSSINTPNTYSFCRVDLQKHRENKNFNINTESNQSKEEIIYSAHPVINNTKSLIVLDYNDSNKKKLIISNHPEELSQKVRSMKISRKNSEGGLNSISKTMGENILNKESFYQSKPQLNSHRVNENSKNKIKIIKQNFKLSTDKLDKGTRLKDSIIKTKVSEILKNTYSYRDKKEATSITERKDNNLDLVSEYKMITEFIKTSKNNFGDHLYQKVSSNYFSETNKVKGKESVSVVDCLALDNFNRIFCRASLPVLSPRMLPKSNSKNNTEIQFKTLTKHKNINLKKIKMFNYLEKNSKVNSISGVRSTQASVLNLNSIINMNKDEYSQTAR